VAETITGATLAGSAETARRWSPMPLLRLFLAMDAAVLLALLVAPQHWRLALLGLLLNHLLLGSIGLWPRSRLIDRNIVRLPAAARARAEVGLSFDDGPDPAVTPQVLDLLDRHGAKASFFFPALRAAAHPELVREVIRRGHSVENHSYRHSNHFAWYGWSRLRCELEQAQALLAELSGRTPRFFRAPMGLRSPWLDPLLWAAGLRQVAWTRRGYDAVCGEPDQVLRRLLRGLDAGDILLLHDGRAARTPQGEAVVLEVLPQLLQRLADAGLRGVSLPMAFQDEG
jgi:peptidoglycan/xylan/chitin deacetylase (PgdA/CDA1 family)